ncbi:alpha/beta fold hydrolase [Nocardia terpenica]|uniref:alpha/beta fold hydrolase n=1 Tax=Nocardia terpenica TaxID=455432 RepID=UPI001895E47C|nr:alpha/beta hydrolase [Nocardia terpenica]MBF6061176.1 alpha/beta fold hydrolase [Nocardia terpenica]MBF6105595.1 alpha/beta fold hydrolase [Nocardia terpenica]MBF6112935.1 alpha/beta fold hydrolase [Nocardia terpenica]MBF6119065.1 alpha/beta fold hydrolase [Nocardia terpenica]MBF6152713.1 alpha/beta fold hydrolase [Nocardia terpenica]
MNVPLDYRDPGGPTIGIALAKLPARKAEQRKGALVINRGGPGYSSIIYLELLATGQVSAPWDDTVADRYDLVAIDARGVGLAPSAITCFESPAAASAFGAGVPVVPVDEAQAAQVAAKDAEYVDRCRQRNAAVLDHLTTANVARDMDLVRAGLGEQSLNYLGQSYGAALGFVYAGLFPDRVGRFVLDSVDDPVRATDGPAGSITSERTGTDVATQQAMDEFLGSCEQQQSCAFATDQPRRAYPELLRELRLHPLEVVANDGTHASLTYAKLIAYLGGRLYQPTSWRSEQVDRLLDSAYRASRSPSDPAAAELARLVLDKVDKSGLDNKYSESPILSQAPYYAFTCNDDRLPRSADAWWTAATRRESLAPGFATLRAFDTSVCAAWRPENTERYTGPWRVHTQHPVLLVNDRIDPATPLPGAEDIAHRLDNSRLLVNNGVGHVTTMQSHCAISAVSDYLVSDALPAETASCTPDRAPFE